jgi:hypothetical protein
LIVLDENLDWQRVFLPLDQRYRGRVLYIRSLRPQSVIKDEAIPSLLIEEKKPTFITINARDFWRIVSPHERYCIVCVPFPTARQPEIPDLIMRFMRQAEFRTVEQRMGKVIRLTG